MRGGTKTGKRSGVIILLMLLCLLCIPQTALAKSKVIKAKRITKSVLKQLNLKKIDHVMIVAHPDDETLWGGAHLMKDNYLVVCLTNGNNATRKQEFTRAMKRSGDNGIILCYPDFVRNKAGGFAIDSWSSSKAKIQKDIQVLLSYKQWKTIVTHNKKGEYGHIHHKKTHNIVTKVAKKLKKTDKLYYFGTYYSKKKLTQLKKKPAKLETRFRKKKKELIAAYPDSRTHSFRHMISYENWEKAVSNKKTGKTKTSKTKTSKTRKK